MAKSPLTFAFVLAACICFSLSILTIWNLYLILSAQTTVEFYKNRFVAAELKQRGIPFVNEYDIGTLNNLRIFFNTKKLLVTVWLLFFFDDNPYFSNFLLVSPSPWWMALLPVRIPAYGDGTSFSTFWTTKTMDV